MPLPSSSAFCFRFCTSEKHERSLRILLSIAQDALTCLETALKNLDASAARLQLRNERRMQLQLPPQMQLSSLETERSRAEKRAAISAHISVLRRESPKFASDLYDRRHELLIATIFLYPHVGVGSRVRVVQSDTTHSFCIIFIEMFISCVQF